jgi:2-keto-4-pentenoate hydratase/2-oxohepta-3-ene-1,7-dioic acid hydratase in catechol pathway
LNSVIFKEKKLFPSKIVCVGRNYVEHIEELGNEIPDNIVFFNKPNSSISKDFRYISENVRFEGEISFLILNSKIAGVGFGFDLTDAEIQNYLKSKGLPWERAKAFNGSALFTDFIPIEDDEVKRLSFKLFQNGELVQYAYYQLMIYKPNTILNEIKKFMSLEDGDIIMSGTPKGVGYYNIGDIFKVELSLNDEVVIKKDWKVIE